MKARTFIGLMFLLLAFTSFLLVMAAPGKQDAQKKERSAGTSRNEDPQVQAADGTMIWESVSRHLLSAVQ